MLKYAPYDQSEYSCIACPEAVTDFYLKLDSLESRKANLELQKQQVERESQSSLLSVKEAVVAEVQEYLGTGDIIRRRHSLGRMLPNLKTCLERGVGGIMRSRFTAAAQEILRNYATLDVEAFQADIDSFIDETGDGKSLRDQLRSLNGKLGAAASEITKLWQSVEQDDFKTLFHIVPIQWRDWKFKIPMVDGPEKEQAIERERRKMAERIIRSFVRDWKDRAKYFDKPVSVTGVAIHTMPTFKRRAWDAAYNKLELKKIPKQAYFQSITSHEREQKDEPATVPHPMFTEEGMKDFADAEMA